MHFAEFAEQAILKLVGPFWGKPRIASVLLSIVSEIQELEDTFRDIEEQRDLPTADATRLEVLGRLVGQGSLGLSLEGHRSLISGRVRANRSSGKADDILEVCALLGITSDVNVRDLGNATLLVEVIDPITAEAAFSLNLLVPDIRSAGVGAFTITADDSFTIPAAVADLVFGDVNDFVTTPGNSLYNVTVG